MRRLLKFLLYALLALVAVVLAGLGYVYFASSRLLAKTYAVTPPPVAVAHGDPAVIEHGRYLAHKVSMCIECHGEDLGGKVYMDAMPVMARLWGTNLTRGRGGIGGTYTDADFVRALTHGVKKDGRAALFMPSQDYHFSEADLAGLIAYIRSLPPVDRETPPPAIGPMARILTLAGAFPLLPAEMIRHDAVTLAPPPDRTTPEKSGEYLISTGACRGCHGPALTGEGGMPDAANLTPVGLAGWSAADFKRALRDGKRPNGTDIKPEMPRVFGTMSDEDLESLFAYLQSLPPAGVKSKYQ
jgi:cytochrome c553